MTTSEDAVGRVETSLGRWYIDELPLPEEPEAASLEAGLEFVGTYTGLPRAEVRRHVKDIRDKAFAVYKYPCLGRWRFLHLHLLEHPEYQNILTRLQSGEKLLDAGCCFGHVLRQLALASGAPTENLAGVDIDKEFIDLGYEFFRDRDRFKARFVVGDVLNSSPSLETLDHQFDIIHASSFLHLFGWDDQVKIAVRLIRFFRPEATKAMIVGRQVAEHEAQSLEAWRKDAKARSAVGERKNYRHDLKSWRVLWDEVGVRTGTKWEASGDLLEGVMDGASRTFMRFTVKKLA